MARLGRNLHDKPFDEGTLAKLALFRSYVREWLPVFIAKEEIYWPNINIIDFFAGPGTDINGRPGSPIIIIEELIPYAGQIKAKGLKVYLYFNEFDSEKYEQLRTHSLLTKEVNNSYSIKFANKDFKEAFQDSLPTLESSKSANLVFPDQTGIKQVNDEVFQRLVNLKHTDFLFFVSSSTIKRFAEQPSIQKYIKLEKEQIEKTPFHEIHRLVLEYYKSLIGNKKGFYLASFSLKKSSGLYGVIFGSSNVLGIEKFLKASWKIDPERGEANFDIDDDRIQRDQLELITGEVRKPKKVEFFEGQLREKILNKEIQTDREIYLFTLSMGFLPSHAKEIIQKMIKEGRIAKNKMQISNNVCKKSAEICKIQLL